MHLALGVWAIFWLLFWVFVGRPWLERRRTAKYIAWLHQRQPEPDPDPRGVAGLTFGLFVVVAIAVVVAAVVVPMAAHGG